MRVPKFCWSFLTSHQSLLLRKLIFSVIQVYFSSLVLALQVSDNSLPLKQLQLRFFNPLKYKLQLPQFQREYILRITEQSIPIFLGSKANIEIQHEKRDDCSELHER
jgi:hypothetical protein